MMAQSEATAAGLDAESRVGPSGAQPQPPQLPQKIVITPQRRALGTRDAAFALHALCFMTHVRVWGWHTSEQAAAHPGAQGFGWFFRYLTFYSFSLQVLQLALAALSDITDEDSRYKRRLERWADDMSCALFSLANVVTIMYYIVQTSTNVRTLQPGSRAFARLIDIACTFFAVAGDVEGKGAVRPPWLGFAVHVYNSIAAWGDLLLSRPRTFSQRSLKLSLGIASFYLCWILVCSHFNGIFPYPFLNKLPWPQGFFLVALAANVLFCGLFYLGRGIASLLPWNGNKSKED